MSKYDRLAAALADCDAAEWRVSFRELEALLGVSLPSSAYHYPAWWSNNPTNNAMTRVWLRAGWRTEQVDVPGQSVVFRRAPEKAVQPPGLSDRGRDFEIASARAPETKMATARQAEDSRSAFERLYGCLAGAFKIPTDVDALSRAWSDEEAAASSGKWDRLLPGPKAERRS